MLQLLRLIRARFATATIHCSFIGSLRPQRLRVCAGTWNAHFWDAPRNSWVFYVITQRAAYRLIVKHSPARNAAAARVLAGEQLARRNVTVCDDDIFITSTLLGNN